MMKGIQRRGSVRIIEPYLSLNASGRLVIQRNV